MRRISYAWMLCVALLACLAGPAAAAKKAPDLKITALKASGAHAPGASFSVQATVKNAGEAKAKASQTAFVLSRDAKSGKEDAKLGARNAKALAVKKTAKATLALTVPAGTAAGAYKLIACADARKKVKESSERNNCKAASITVVPRPLGGPQAGPPAGGPIFVPPGGGTPGGNPTPTPTVTATPTPTPTVTPGDKTAPDTTITAGPAPSNDLPTATLEFGATEAATFECRLDTTAWTACTSPKTYSGLADGVHSFAVRAKDGAGNVDATPATREWTRFPAPPLPLPKKAEDVAPAPKTTEATSLAEGADFLYKADGDTIQDQVQEQEMEPRQLAVLRGRVLKPDNTPMPKARVTVLDHPEYGYTTTRDDGRYDIAVNGGEQLTLHFEQGELEGEKYTSVQRTQDVPWQDYVDVEDVVMTAYTEEVTTIDENAGGVQVATSEVTPEDDADPRKATLMFDPGTDATMTTPDGREKPLGDLEVRATEYTAGPAGDERMPGDLPSSSAYTYAVEFSVDDAVEQGATDVEFNKPVTTYVDNFLKFKAGTIVPSAYYDEAQGAWIPAENGIVIDLKGKGGDGLALIDADGDALADSAADLAKLGIDAVERQKLGQEYPTAGTSLWRVPVKHFTPWDYNWPYGCKAECDPPDEEPPPPPYCPECQAAGSIVGMFNQTLGEALPVTGSPFELHYESGRVPGYKEAYKLEIPLTGPTVRDSLRRVELEVTVAGRVFRQTFDDTPNQSHTFTWDGKDAYGREVEGAQNASVRIGYVYPAEYLEPDEFEASFGQFGGRPVERVEGTDETRREIVTWQEWERPVGTLGAGSDALGGWTLDVHHSYDPAARVLHRGDGSRVTTEAIRSEMRTVAGRDPYSWWDDETEATRQELGTARGMDVGADGSLYIARTSENEVVRVTPAGEVETVAGGFFADAEDLGDGGRADRAKLLGPTDVAVAQDGTIFIADTGNARIRRVDTDGVITTYAGGADPEKLGDAGPATEASLKRPRGLALAADGTLYIAEAGRDRVRRVGPDGRISTAAGGGTALGDGGQATDASLDQPVDVAIDVQGTLYVADSLHHRVRKIAGTGEIETIAGNGGAGASGDGGAATAAAIGQPYGVDVGADGMVYVADRIHHRVLRISPDGQITAFAGTGRSGGDGDGGAPLQARLSFPEDVTVAPDGSVHVADTGNGRIRRAAPGLPGFTDADFSLPSEDGTEVYMFDRNGRHLRTVEALTGALKWKFAYDAAGRLITVTDGDDNATSIVREGGKATEIVAPGGIETKLSIPGAMLEQVTNPENEAVTLGYGTGGLLTSLTDARGKQAEFGYDASGLLISDKDKRGKTQTFARTATDTGFKVVRTSPEGRKTVFESTTLPNGDVRTTTRTEPSAATSTIVNGRDGVTRMTGTNGTTTETTLGADPRWGMRAPIPRRIVKRTPGGRKTVVERERTVQLAEGGDPFKVERLEDRFTVDGRTHTRTYDGETATLTTESAGGRTMTAKFDAKGRITERGFGAGVEPIATTYDARGRIAKVKQGTAERTYEYDATKPFRLVARTDGENRKVRYGYDDAERITSITMPSNRAYGFEYDDAGNRTKVRMPNGAEHVYGYEGGGEASSYAPPGGTAWTRTFDGDRLLSGLTLPGHTASTNARDASGRKTGIAGEGSTSFAIDDATSLETSATRTLPGGSFDKEATGYDGTLAVERQSSDAGGVYASHVLEYGDDLEVDAIVAKAGGKTVRTEIERDADALPEKLGPFTLTRGGPLGRVSAIAGDDLSIAIGADAKGRVSGRTVTVGGGEKYESTVGYDRSNRVTSRTETVDGQTSTYTYTYTPDGELDTVKRGDTVVEDYAYDVNGNRTSGGAAYETDDRLKTLGGTSYTYDAAGFLKTRGADAFTYSAAGELLQATVGGTTVRYAYDTLGRRTARTQGSATTRYLYGNPAEPYQVTGVVGSDGKLTTLYYGRGDTLFALEREGVWHYVATDEVGTPELVAAANGDVVKTFAYDSFGVRDEDAEEGTFELPIGFAGGLDDPVTKLVRFGQRDYEPAAGRWTARDPILHGGGLNLYAYVNSNPVNHRDPSGLAEGGGDGGGGGFMGMLESIGEYFTDGDGGTAVEAISNIESDSPVVEGAKTLTDGMDKLETIQDVAETALEVKEALDEPTDPEQAAGLLKCGLKWIKKILPVELTPTEAAEEALDQGMEHAKHQRDFGTINRGAARQMAQIEW